MSNEIEEKGRLGRRSRKPSGIEALVPSVKGDKKDLPEAEGKPREARDSVKKPEEKDTAGKPGFSGLPFSFDPTTNVLTLRRQSLDDLKGSDFMSKWRSSDAYRGAEAAKNIRSTGTFTPELAMRMRHGDRVLASDVRAAQAYDTEMRKRDFQLHLQAEKQRADAYYDLWKENNRKRRGESSESAKSSPEKTVAASESAASNARVERAVTQAEAPVKMPVSSQDLAAGAETAGAEADKVEKNLVTPVASDHGPVVNVERPPTPEEKRKIDEARKQEQAIDEELERRSKGFGILTAAHKGGYSALGSDGRYHRFSLQADYAGGRTVREGWVAPERKPGTVQRATEEGRRKYLDKDGNLAAERQKYIDAEMKKGGTRIFVNGQEVSLNQAGSVGSNVYTRTSGRSVGEGPATASASGRVVAPGTVEFSARTEKMNEDRSRATGTPAQWQQRWNAINKIGKKIDAMYHGSLATKEGYYRDNETGQAWTSKQAKTRLDYLGHGPDRALADEATLNYARDHYAAGIYPHIPVSKPSGTAPRVLPSPGHLGTGVWTGRSVRVGENYGKLRDPSRGWSDDWRAVKSSFLQSLSTAGRLTPGFYGGIWR